MKKIFSICLVVIVLCTSVSVFAAPNGFISSPSGNPAPEVVEFKPGDDDCTAELIVTPYSEKEELPEELQNLMNKAYNEVLTSEDLTKLNDLFEKLVKDKGIDPSNLAVSDLFDIHVTGCLYHDGHVDFDITLDVEKLSHFVGLLHLNKDGVWELVEDAKVVNNGEHLKFSVESFSPFAIIVDTTKDIVDTPPTGDNSMIYVYIAIMVVSALGIVFIAIKSKSKR